MGRHTTYTQEVADELLRRLSGGEPLAKICRDAHMPATRTVSDWKAASPDFSAAVARARDDGFDEIAVETIDIVDEKPPLNAFGNVDSGYVTWQRMRAEQRLKLLACWDPRRYGNKLELAGDAASPLVIQTVQYTPKDEK